MSRRLSAALWVWLAFAAVSDPEQLSRVLNRVMGTPPVSSGGGGSFVNANCASPTLVGSLVEATVQSAVNAAAAGACLKLPAGSVAWTSALTITKNIALIGSGGGRVEGTSVTSNSIGTGTKTFTIVSGTVKSTGWTNGEAVIVHNKSDNTKTMTGTVTSWNGTSLVLSIASSAGTGTYTGWVMEMPASTIITHNAGSANLFDITESTAGFIELAQMYTVYGTGTGAHIHPAPTTSGFPTLVHDFRINALSGNHAVDRQTNKGVFFRVYFDAGFDWVHAANSHNTASGMAGKVTTTGWSSTSTMGTNDTTGRNNFYVEDCFFEGLTTEAMDFDDEQRTVVRHNVFDNAAITSHGTDTSNIGNRHFEIYDNLFIFDLFNGNDATVPDLDYWFFLRGGTGLLTDNVMPDIDSTEWGNKGEIKFTVMSPNRNSGPYACWAGGYPAPRQTGFGRVTGAGSTGTFGYLGDIEPLYVWNNGSTAALGIDQYSPDECGNGAVVTTYLQSGRDYNYSTNGTAAKPSYTKYTYPHPDRNGV